MPEKYGPNARAALLVLMLENREVPNKELVNQHKIRLSPADRDPLIEDEVLRTRTENRRLLLEITGKGIKRCLTDLVEGAPPSRSGPLARMYNEVLRRMVQYFEEQGTLVEAIGFGDLELLIRMVYVDMSVGPQDWIRLARIRPRLNGADKSEVDKVLLKMMKARTIHLAPSSNRKVLTDDDRAAAVRIGGEDKHLIAIEES